MTSATTSKATEGSFLQNFAGTQPGKAAPKVRTTKSGIQVERMVAVPHVPGYSLLDDMFGGKR